MAGQQRADQELTLGVYMQMEQIPTCVYNQLRGDEYPLLSCEIRSDSLVARQFLVRVQIDHYSAVAEATVTVDPASSARASFRPILLPQAIAGLRATTAASVVSA